MIVDKFIGHVARLLMERPRGELSGWVIYCHDEILYFDAEMRVDETVHTASHAVSTDLIEHSSMTEAGYARILVKDLLLDLLEAIEPGILDDGKVIELLPMTRLTEES